jgi:hypothetical protein
MPIAQLIVVAIRLLVPLSIVRWPLAGAVHYEEAHPGIGSRTRSSSHSWAGVAVRG